MHAPSFVGLAPQSNEIGDAPEILYAPGVVKNAIRSEATSALQHAHTVTTTHACGQWRRWALRVIPLGTPDAITVYACNERGRVLCDSRVIAV